VLRDHINFVTQALADSGEKGRIVDVGCGGGLFLKILRERGYPGVGLDNSTGAARVAWKQNGVPVVCGDLTYSPLDRGSFSLVSMFHVLEHVYDPVSYLRTARDLLSYNGRLVVQVPNASSWQFLIFGEHWNGVDVPRHLVDYRQDDLENLLDYCGFEVLRRKHFSLRDNPAGFATSLAPSLDPMARRVRSVKDSSALRLIKDCLYLGLTIAALPFAVFEAACGAGSSIMIEARKKP
jgi:SAM-dependent methyltransferase